MISLTQPAFLSSEHVRATAVSVAQGAVAAQPGAAADQRCEGAAARRAEADSPNDRTQWSFRVDPPTLHTTRVFELRTSSCHCCIRRGGAVAARARAADRRYKARRHVVPRPTHPTTALLGVSALTLPRCTQPASLSSEHLRATAVSVAPERSGGAQRRRGGSAVRHS